MSEPVTTPSQPQTRVVAELMTSDGWVYRRWMLFGVVTFVCAAIGFLIVQASTGPIAALAIPNLFTALMTFVLAYVFGAMWDDRNRRSHYFNSVGSSLGASDDESTDDTSKAHNPAH